MTFTDSRSVCSYRRGRKSPAPSAVEAIKTEEDSDDDSASVDAPAGKESKYRRMRDLNNAASKRCRQNRKRKQNALEDEAVALEKRNAVLKARCEKMEQLVDRMKKEFIKKVASRPKTPLDLDQIMAERLSSI